MKKGSKWAIVGIFLLAGMILLQGQTFYGKRRTGFYSTKEDGSPFGYYIPRTIDENKTYPLIIVFGQKATAAMKWKNLADEKGLVIAAIQPKLGGVWNFQWDTDRALTKTKQMMEWYPIDSAKILATGYEEGGSFALVMAINYPELFSAGAAIDAKTANFILQNGDVDRDSKIDPFAYDKNPAKQKPLWLMSYTKSEFVPAEDLDKTHDFLKEYGYSVTYETVVGEPHPPSQKNIRQIYRWFNSQTS